MLGLNSEVDLRAGYIIIVCINISKPSARALFYILYIMFVYTYIVFYSIYGSN